MQDPQGMPAAPSKGSPRTRLALRFISGKYQGGEFPIEEDHPIVVGRSSDLDMVLVEEMVSRKHAKIEMKDGKIHIEDLGSTNGTFVNGERIAKGWLKEGDRVLIGSNILKVIATSEEAVPNTRRGSATDVSAVAAKPSSPKRSAEGSGESRMRGSLEEIPLPDLLQLFGTSRKSGVLTVESDHDGGHIFLDQGLIHYVTVEQNGKEVVIAPLKAFYRMLLWERGSFELEPPSTRKFETPLNASVQEVLMEGFRQRDEFEHMKGKLPDLETHLEFARPLAKPLRELSPAQLDVFQAVLNGGTFRAVLDASPQTDLEVAQSIVALVDKGYVKKG